MANKIYKNSYSTIFLELQQQANPSSSLTAYDLSSTTSTFTLSTSLTDPILITKSSNDSDQIAYTAPTSGQLEVYITSSDTKNLEAGLYYYTLYVVDSSGRQYVADNDKIKLIDTVDS